jgi:chorismate mutase
MTSHRETVHIIPARLLTALLFAITTVQTGCVTRPSQPSPAQIEAETAVLDDVLGLIQQRLALMHEVARWKWNVGKPIVDPARERDLLNQVTASGQEKGLPQSIVRPFFAAQIEAGKLVQHTDFECWRAEKQGRFSAIKNLAAIRGQIDALNGRLIDALAAASPLLSRPTAQEMLDRRAARMVSGAGIDGAVRNVAIAPLKKRTGNGAGFMTIRPD